MIKHSDKLKYDEKMFISSKIQYEPENTSRGADRL